MGAQFKRIGKQVVRGLTRYYVLRQLSSKPSKHGQWVLALLRSLQLLTLLLPLYSSQGDSWAFASFWPCWYVLNIAGRQDRILQALLSPVHVVEFLYVGLVVWRLCTFGASILYYGNKSKSAYWQLVETGKEHGLGKWLCRVDQGSIFLLSGLFAIPAVNVLAETALCGNDCAEVNIAGRVALPAVLVCILSDRFFLVDISWKTNSDGPISPRFSLILTISELSAALVVALSSALITSTVLFLCGVLKVIVVYYALPFHSPLRNLAESSQGVALLWEASLCLLVQGVPTASLAPAMLLLFGLPVVVAINFTMLKSHTEAYLQQGITIEAQYAQAVLRAGKQPSMSRDSGDSLRLHPLLGALDLSSLKLYPLLWTAYYYLCTEEYYFAKVTIGLIAGQSRNWRNTVLIETCFARLYVKLRENEEDEKFLQQFLLLNPLLAEIQRYDYFTTSLIRDFDECIEWKSSSFDRLVQVARKAAHFAAKTAKLYHQAISTFPTKATLVQQFASFLEMMGKLQEAEKFINHACKITHKTHKKTTISAKSLLEDDSNCMIFATSLTGSGKGLINWSINEGLLGYSAEDLKGMNCSMLLPRVFHTKWSEILGGLVTQRTVPYISRSDAYLQVLLVNKRAELVSGTGRIFLSNDRETGNLMGIALIRYEPVAKDFALLGPYGGLVECTANFAAFKQETRFLSECNFSHKDVIWKGDWRGSQLIVSTDTWTVCTDLQFPSISLYRMRSRQSTTADFSVISETHLTRYGKSAALFQSLYSTVDTDWLQRSVENSQVAHNKTLSQAQVIKRKVKKLNKWLILTLILAFLTGAAVAVIVVQSFFLSVQEINQAIAGITAVGMRVLSLSAAIRSKELFLVASGFSLYGNETVAKANLLSISTNLGQMHASLYANLSTATGFYQQQLITPITPFWRYENGRFRKYELTLLDVMDEMARRSASLANCSLASVTERNSDFMTLYRNGVEEALVAFNASVGAFAVAKDRARAEILHDLELAALLGSLVCLGVFVPLVSGLLLALERKRKQVWTDLLNLPKEVVTHALELANTRLEALRINDLYVEKSDALKQVCRYHTSRDTKVLAVAAILLCCVISLSGLVLFLSGDSAMNSVLMYKPGYIDWMGMRRAAVMKSWFHMRESWLPANLSYSVLIPSVQTQFSQPVHWERANSLLLMLHRCYVAGCHMHNMHHLFPSNAHKDILMGAVPNTTALALKAGLTPLLNEIVLLSSAARSELKSDPATPYSKGKKVEQYINLAYSALTVSNRQFDADTIHLLDEANTVLKQATVAVVCFVLALLALGALPLLCKVSSLGRSAQVHCERQQRSHSSQPQDSSESICNNGSGLGQLLRSLRRHFPRDWH